MQHISVSQAGYGSHLSLQYFDLTRTLTIEMSGRGTAQDLGSRMASKNRKEKGGALILL